MSDIEVKAEGLGPLMVLLPLAPQMITDEITKAMTQATLTLEKGAKELVRVKTGHLRRSITSKVQPITGGVQGLVGTNVEYGPYVEFGTGIYGPEKKPIVPVNAKALKIPVPGGFIFRRSVKGAPAKPYLKPSFDQNKQKIQEFFHQALVRVVRRLATGGG